MGVDTKVFVAADKSKLLEAVGEVKKHLDIFIRTNLDAFVEDKGYNNRFNAVRNCKEDHGVRYSNGVSQTCVDFMGSDAIFQIMFGCGDTDDRILHCTQMNAINEIIEGNKIIFSLGCWGSNEDIAKILCGALAKFGPVYYDFNDCDDIDFQLY